MIEWLSSLKNSGKVIIVEGEKDLFALSKLGVCNVVAISRKPLYQVIEELPANKGVIILTDLDKEGRKLYNMLKHNLQKQGFKVDNKFREALFKDTNLSHIEGLYNYLSRNFSWQQSL